MSEPVYLRHVVAFLALTDGHVAFAEIALSAGLLVPSPQVLIRIVIPPNRQAVPRKAQTQILWSLKSATAGEGEYYGRITGHRNTQRMEHP
jgi:hypothetical protein